MTINAHCCADLELAQKGREPIIPKGHNRLWKPCSREPVQIGCFYKFTNSSHRTEWCTFIEGEFRHLLIDGGETYETQDDIFDVLSKQPFGFVKANGGKYACGEANTVTEKKGLRDIIESIVQEAKPLEQGEFPLINSIDSSYLDKSYKEVRGENPVEHDSVIIHYGFYVCYRFTREDTDIVARRLLKKYGLRKTKKDSYAIQKIANMLRVATPKTKLQMSILIKLLADQIGADWWREIKENETISKDNVWIRLLKREKGI